MNKGLTLKEQIERLGHITKIEFVFHENTAESLEVKTKAYSYINTKAKYIFRRILSEGKLKHMIQPDQVVVYKELAVSQQP